MSEIETIPFYTLRDSELALTSVSKTNEYVEVHQVEEEELDDQDLLDSLSIGLDNSISSSSHSSSDTIPLDHDTSFGIEWPLIDNHQFHRRASYNATEITPYSMMQISMFTLSEEMTQNYKDVIDMAINSDLVSSKSSKDYFMHDLEVGSAAQLQQDVSVDSQDYSNTPAQFIEKQINGNLELDQLEQSMAVEIMESLGTLEENEEGELFSIQEYIDQAVVLVAEKCPNDKQNNTFANCDDQVRQILHAEGSIEDHIELSCTEEDIVQLNDDAYVYEVKEQTYLASRNTQEEVEDDENIAKVPLLLPLTPISTTNLTPNSPMTITTPSDIMASAGKDSNSASILRPRSANLSQSTQSSIHTASLSNPYTPTKERHHHHLHLNLHIPSSKTLNHVKDVMSSISLKNHKISQTSFNVLSKAKSSISLKSPKGKFNSLKEKLHFKHNHHD